MSGSLGFVLALATAFLAASGFLTRRVRAGNLALAGAGAGAAGLLLLRGHLGLAVAVGATSWSVVAAAQVMSRLIEEVEARRETTERPPEPWLVALFSAVLLTVALGVASVAVNWPGAPRGRSAPAEGGAPPGGALPEVALPGAAPSAVEAGLLALASFAAIWALAVVRRSVERDAA
jgi:hypothetical protein